MTQIFISDFTDKKLLHVYLNLTIKKLNLVYFVS